MKELSLFPVGKTVYFAVEDPDGGLLEKEGVIDTIVSEGSGFAGDDPVYHILVEAENRVYQHVPGAVVRELTAASGVEDGDYGFNADDIERSFRETVLSLWYGMDPRGDENEKLDPEMERILTNALNEDASGFAIESGQPPEDED